MNWRIKCILMEFVYMMASLGATTSAAKMTVAYESPFPLAIVFVLVLIGGVEVGKWSKETEMLAQLRSTPPENEVDKDAPP